VAQVRKSLEGQPSGSVLPGPEVAVAGRVSVIRDLGKTAFVPIREWSGELQLYLAWDQLGEERYRHYLSVLDPGDIVGARGLPLLTRRGEPSLQVREMTLLAKALRPPPEKYHGLRDPETLLRQRYLDLIASRESLRRFHARSLVVRELRRFLDQEGFLEVETPVLGSVASGGAARPFVTHYNFLDEDLFLRISLELPLKKLLVGGFEKIYEIGHNFRNEDLDALHSPEFTMMELYWAYADYHDIRDLVERLLPALGEAVGPWVGPEQRERLQRDLKPPFPRVDFVEALEAESGVSRILERPREELLARAREVGAAVRDDSSVGHCLDKLFGHYVEPKLRSPTFVMDHPESTTPLAKRHRSKPGRVERFELFYRGFELCNAYSELNDPEEQDRRFREQRRGGTGEPMASDEETYGYDPDFVEALRYGMPPAGGLGLGIDRLLMLLLGCDSIKDVILFPATRRRPDRAPD